MNALQAYKVADSVVGIEATGIPALVHKASTDVIQLCVAPHAAVHSSAPEHIVYRHWADMYRRIAFGKKVTLEQARAGDPVSYRIYVLLMQYGATRTREWVERGLAIDPEKGGYKAARKLAEAELTDKAVQFRAALDLFEESALGQLVISHG